MSADCTSIGEQSYGHGESQNPFQSTCVTVSEEGYHSTVERLLNAIVKKC